MASRDLALRLLITARDTASGVIGAVTGKVAKFTAAIGALVGGAALARFFGSAISGAASLQAQMSELGGVTGATTEDLAGLQARAEQLGASDKLQVTSKQAAEAMTELGRAGQSTGEILNSVESVLALAQGGMLGTGEAAGIVASALSGMGLAADQAGRVTDVLSLAAQSGNTTVQGLAEALGYAAPAAAAAGQSLEQTVAQITLMQDAGIAGTRAGTALNGMLAALANPASTASKALDAAGISARDFNGVLAGLATAQGPAAEAAILAFGTEAGPALRALLGQGNGAVEALVARLDAAEGAALRTAAAMTDNLNGAVESLGSVWEAMQQSLVQPLLEPIEAQVRKLAAAIGEFAASPAFGELKIALVDGFKAAAAAAQEFAASIDWQALLSQIGDFARSAGEHFRSVTDSIAALGDATSRTISAMSAAWGGFRSGVELVAAAVTEQLGIILEGVAWAADGLNRVGVVSEETALKTRAAQETMADASRQFKEASIQHWNEAKAAAASALGETEKSADSAAAAIDQTGQQAGLTADQLDALGEGASYAADGYDGLSASADSAAESIKGTGDAAQTSQGKIDSAIEKMDAALQAYYDLRDGGEATVNELIDAWARYEAALNESRTAQAELRTELRAARDDVTALEEDFKSLGIESAATMRFTAEAALASFERIRKSSTTTTEDVARAWEAYAARAIASGDRVQLSIARQEGTVLGLADRYRELAGEKEASADAGKRGADEAEREADALERGATAAEAKAAAQQEPRRQAVDFEQQYAEYGTDIGRFAANNKGAPFLIPQYQDYAMQQWNAGIGGGGGSIRTLRLEFAGKSGIVTGDASLLEELERQAAVSIF